MVWMYQITFTIQNFLYDYFLSESNYGSMYKATFKDDYIIPMKQLKSYILNGDLEFLNKVETLIKLKHMSLVNL